MSVEGSIVAERSVRMHGGGASWNFRHVREMDLLLLNVRRGIILCGIWGWGGEAWIGILMVG